MAKAQRSTATGLRDLRGAATAPPKTSKINVPTANVSAANAKAIGAWREAKQDEVDAKARREAAEGQLMPEARQLRGDACRRDSKLYPSIKLLGDGQVLKVVQTSRMKKMPAGEAEDPLTVLFGTKFDTYFRIRTGAKVRDDISPNDERKLAQVLEKAFGDRWEEVIEMNPVVEPTERLFHDMILESRIAKVCESAQADGFLELFKPAFKL